MKTPRTSASNWAKLFQNLDPDLVDRSYSELIELYSQEHRHYHNLTHINACLLIFDQVKKFCKDPNAVEIAIWCHDVIYDPLRQDNEERSAAWILERLQRATTIPDNAMHITRLIKATTSHKAYDTDSQLLNDIDFSILGAPAPEYNAYSNAIRKEYSHIDNTAYSFGRQEVLANILRKDSIFNFVHFINTYERATRQNLENEIRYLQSSL